MSCGLEVAFTLSNFQACLKRKNSKFFKLCQTLKTKYRVRKQHSESGARLVPIENDPRDENRVVYRYSLPAEYENDEYEDDYEKQFRDFPYPSSGKF